MCTSVCLESVPVCACVRLSELALPESESERWRSKAERQKGRQRRKERKRERKAKPQGIRKHESKEARKQEKQSAMTTVAPLEPSH